MLKIIKLYFLICVLFKYILLINLILYNKLLLINLDFYFNIRQVYLHFCIKQIVVVNILNLELKKIYFVISIFKLKYFGNMLETKKICFFFFIEFNYYFVWKEYCFGPSYSPLYYDKLNELYLFYIIKKTRNPKDFFFL